MTKTAGGSAIPELALAQGGAGVLFQLLRDGKARTRAELALITGLARSTVASRIDALIASGLVGPAGEATSSGGRPPSRFAFNPAARVVLAVDVGATPHHRCPHGPQRKGPDRAAAGHGHCGGTGEGARRR